MDPRVTTLINWAQPGYSLAVTLDQDAEIYRDCFTERPWTWEAARRSATHIYETCYGA